jgi:tetratricopeptide (TPR) repeat protein
MPRLNQRLGLTRYEADEAYKQALDDFQKRDFDNAIDHMSKAIDALPSNSEYYAARGLMYVEDAEYEKAEEDFAEALRLFPYEMLAHYGRGVIAYKRRQWDEALAHFTKAYHAKPDRAETQYYLALTHYQRGEYASAANYMVAANALFEAANDKRKADSARWIKELSKHKLPTQQALKETN